MMTQNDSNGNEQEQNTLGEYGGGLEEPAAEDLYPGDIISVDGEEYRVNYADDSLVRVDASRGEHWLYYYDGWQAYEIRNDWEPPRVLLVSKASGQR